MKISVVIPTFNRKEALKRAIHSVMGQSLTPFEIIVVDDGSDDGTGEWILYNHPQIKYIYQTNNGVSSARNIGIKSAASDWIAFLDSDDEWLPTKLDIQANAIMANPGTKFCHTNEIWIRNGVRVNQMKKHKKYGGFIFEKCLDICRMSPSSVLINQKIFDEIGMFDESLRVCEDYDLWLRITSKYSVLFLDKPLIRKYGGHSDQLSKVDDGIEFYRIQSLKKIISSKILNKDQSIILKNMLIHKLKIYANGLEKRNKTNELNEIKKNIQYWINIE
ncbi:MAG: glycosyl transferase [Candidatus Marinimicrobia bacterium]|nr:glycosyl transferase [Candidatus Neomarinimicrobiota bacterium]|tara:strand:+ start:6129 stop:6956 length:828 start_codon:yes stop_codon:yes gene_type:complete